MPELPQELVKDDFLSAAWLNRLRAVVKSCRVKIDPTSGLAGTVTADGTVITMQPARDRMVGKLTTPMLARSGSTPGSATVQPYFGTATTLSAYGSTLVIYNWTGSTAPAGTGVKFIRMYGLWWWDGQDCSSAAFP